ncbi:hypothetical protein DFO70_11125 [Cytobacillus firmus]|uniref:Uncharacterized protein n=2 Tax=Cytobacillus TaxID=2675230 RepID=A0A366JPM3_CYTFI|nr:MULTISPECIES: hypothetical protein [Cytobacillus]RBP89378.1 hypothetical protein DFO70_11125 [Cytobacillus firmus]TDX47395.1 hypothetical protein DFO72_101492 [Cytobacillus oceanisediminis]
MEENQITVDDTVIEALENGNVLVNGERIEDINDIEDVLNILIKAVISII